ncbi:Hydroxyisourate hydrolase [Trichodelitschia bisporula]|uniref:5-hydroxyisourate hydrolase n=1 Tax=Trichodelitschia bisporula TaxID=703511 RepID=A0A6G1HUF5_9PEZI|nr:Hydroxyisourate hydrolase [Trichodelitschia bisporula]
MADSRPPITCHILDTTAGRPAPSIPVTLTLLSATGSHTKISYLGTTNSDGRVGVWISSGAQEAPPLEVVFGQYGGALMWELRFEVQEYWAVQGITPFFPVVNVRFQTQGFLGMRSGERTPHWHVPLLLGPFAYSTYRGS